MYRVPVVHATTNMFSSFTVYSYADPQIQQFVKDFSKLIQDAALIPQTDPNTKVINFKQPVDLEVSKVGTFSKWHLSPFSKNVDITM